MSKLKAFIYSLSILSGTIIGVGLFSLPYITAKVGIGIMLGYFLVLGAVVIIVHLFFGELALRTPDFKRLPGFARIYLGNWGEKVATVSAVLGLFGAILAYLIVGGEFLQELLSPIFGGNIIIYTLFYFAVGAGLIFFGIKAIARVEFWSLVLFFLILFIVFLKSFPHIRPLNLFPEPDLSQFFFPYGPILFSLWGATVIPEIEEMLGENKRLFKKIIPLAILIPVCVYLIFIFIILGVMGNQTAESALPGLKSFLGSEIYSLLLFFGILTTFTSFITIGLILKNVFNYDLKIGKNLSWAITCCLPLGLFFLGFKSFIPIISFVGAVMLGIDGILILLMYRKIKTGTSRRLTYPLILVFLIGIIYQIIYLVK